MVIPIALAAVMYSSDFRERTFARTSRPYVGIFTIAIAYSAFCRDGPRIATIAIASRMLGKASRISNRREISISIHLP
ncbi:hypothetical protein D3C74_456540 [compost metagenome]